MKRLLKRAGLWPQRVFEYYTAEVIEPVKVSDSQTINVRRNEMRKVSWVSLFGLKFRRREVVLSRAW